MDATRGVTVWALVALILLGPLAPVALAQPPAPQYPQAPPPAVVTDMTAEYDPRPRPTDVYDVGAVVATVFKAPGNVATCVFGGAVGTALFLVTLGSAYKATVRVFEEGCAQKWIVRGDDIRPRGAPGFLERQSETSYGQGRR